MGVDRRQLLALCAALFAGRIVANAAPLSGRSSLPEQQTGLQLHPDFLREFARHYAASLPDETSTQDLRSDLFLSGMPDATDLASRIRDDFRAFNTVHIDGWLLSKTEARLIYLLAVS